MLEQLNQISFYQKSAPKSLGREWINKEFWHIVRDFDDYSVEDRMKTLVMHIAVQIANAIEKYSEKSLSEMKVLVTGGGAFNQTLMDYISSESDAQIVVPEAEIVNFKEAMVFALLGAMRIYGVPNVMHESTGAKVPVIAGSLDGFMALN